MSWEDPYICGVVVGDSAVGKTCLISSYFRNVFDEDHSPNVFTMQAETVIFEDKRIRLELYDFGQNEIHKDMLRWNAYRRARVVIICFSLVSPASLENAQEIWVPEVKERCPTTPYILVGLKSDLRDQFDERAYEYKTKGWEPVATSRAEEMKKAINAQAYVECSARNRYNLAGVGWAAINAALHPPSAAPAKAEGDGRRQFSPGM
jgi:small GTP-binding protein